MDIEVYFEGPTRDRGPGSINLIFVNSIIDVSWR